jgi:RNA polymerase sigma-70 factor (ECF subfamily)
MELVNPEINHSFKGLVVVMTSGFGTEKTVQKPGLDNNKPDAPDWTQALRQIADSGDRLAFEQVFAHFAPRVKAYMMRLGSDGASAEELTQEALAAVWRKAGHYDPDKAGASTWIFTIARNLRIDAFRKENRPELDPNDPALVPEPDKSAEETVFASQRARQMKVVLRELPEEQRRVVHLSFYEDRTHTEIAGQLDLPLGTVKSRLRLAFQRIRNSLGEDQ